jgi:AcrR family transcriptional regulator
MENPQQEPLRRLPQQARSRQRFNQILDAAAEVFDELGYEAASTELIASRANTSIGSIYRFFPDKSAIIYALAERYAEQLRELITKLFNPSNVHRPLADILSNAVDAFDNFYATQPAARIIYLQSKALTEVQALNRRVDSDIALQLEAFFNLRQPDMTPEKCKVAAMVTVEVAAALQLFYWNQHEALRQQLVAETKLVLTRYLQPLFPDSAQ